METFVSFYGFTLPPGGSFPARSRTTCAMQICMPGQLSPDCMMKYIQCSLCNINLFSIYRKWNIEWTRGAQELFLNDCSPYSTCSVGMMPCLETTQCTYQAMERIWFEWMFHGDQIIIICIHTVMSFESFGILSVLFMLRQQVKSLHWEFWTRTSALRWACI